MHTRHVSSRARVLSDGSLAHSPPPTHTSRYVLHTMHRNLTEMEVALNCELRTAVKKGDEEEVERLVQQGMPTYHYPTIVAVC